MRFAKEYLELYAVTPSVFSFDKAIWDKVEQALAGGVTALQLREKVLKGEALLDVARRLRKLCTAYHVPLIINDSPELALACKADGVHLGQDDPALQSARTLLGKSVFIGISAHSVSEARTAERAGADYLGLGAAFPTATKTDVSVLAGGALAEIAASVAIPSVAIGGITQKNIPALAGTGIAGVAVVTALFDADDVKAAAQNMRIRIQKQLF